MKLEGGFSGKKKVLNEKLEKLKKKTNGLLFLEASIKKFVDYYTRNRNNKKLFSRLSSKRRFFFFLYGRLIAITNIRKEITEINAFLNAKKLKEKDIKALEAKIKARIKKIDGKPQAIKDFSAKGTTYIEHTINLFNAYKGKFENEVNFDEKATRLKALLRKFANIEKQAKIKQFSEYFKKNQGNKKLLPDNSKKRCFFEAMSKNCNTINFTNKILKQAENVNTSQLLKDIESRIKRFTSALRAKDKADGFKKYFPKVTGKTFSEFFANLYKAGEQEFTQK